MTPEEREKLERWAKRVAALEAECGDCTGGAGMYLAGKFPVPDTTGMTPAQAEAVLAAWRAEVNAAMGPWDQPQAEPSGASPAHPSAAPQAPVA